MWTLLELGGLRKVRRSQSVPPCGHFALASSSCGQFAFSVLPIVVLPSLFTELTHGLNPDTCQIHVARYILP